MDKKQKSPSTDLAGRTYDVSDYKKSDELSQGLAMTHEQASDSLTEGTIDGKIENLEGKDIDLPR
ncbi:DUF4025 domain-containing protein [Rossellomorea vietnamensis]|uniref:DUF4025 domain-containing protein n=2 Tax=Rossellomorea TaxID=2837508 RepID=A0A5D4KLT0_9BACI|nr:MULTISPECIES: YozQ family protein [Rossellomorea]TYR77273.1 DUF4025 domain-containing protein [Rossellomorea vietnamensis]TYS78107.1 DUF4025 domain-containing protein [Rossellomorea aquimaris]